MGSAECDDLDLWNYSELPLLYDDGLYRAARDILNRNQMVRCNKCAAVVDKAIALVLGNDDQPSSERGSKFCPACASNIKNEHETRCILCGKVYIDLGRSNDRPSACRPCRVETIQYEKARLSGQLSRARKAGVSATLTIDEWLRTLSDFGRKCAYCGGKYDVMEHYIPVSAGGGTTADNCVPSCLSCNVRKSPASLDEIPANRLVRVELYLLSRRPL